MINSFAFNIPFICIFMAMIAAIITPLLPKKNRIPEKLSCWVIGIIGVLSAYLLYALANSGQSLSFNFKMGHFPAPWGNELRAGPLEAVLSLVFSFAMLLSLTGNFSSTEEDIAPNRRQIFCVLINLLMASFQVLKLMKRCGIKLPSYKKFFHEFMDVISSCNNPESKRIANLAFINDNFLGGDRVIQKRANYHDTSYLPFEMLTLPVPAGYYEVLNQLYGEDWRVFKVTHNHGTFFDTEKPYTYYLDEGHHFEFK